MGGYADAIGGIAKTGEDPGDPNSDKRGGNLITKIVGLNAKWTNEARREREARERAQAGLRQQQAVQQSRDDQRAYEADQNMRPEMTGRLATEYLTPDMLMANDVNDLGGEAFKTLSDAAGGYNPVMAANPRLGVFASDRNALAQLKQDAQAKTASTVGGFEQAMNELGQQYQGAADTLAADRDAMRDTFRETVEDNRAAQDQEMPQNIIESWIASDSKAGIGDNARTLGKWGGRRDKDYVSADSGKKRQLIEGLLADGYSYADMLQDPEFRAWLEADPNTRGILGAWDEGGLGTGEVSTQIAGRARGL